jgi:HK97 family phage major capsid protein
MEKHKAKAGGDGEPVTNPAYGKAYNAFLRRKSAKFEPEAVEANIAGMVNLYYPKADEDTKAAVADMLTKTLVSGSQADGGVWVPVDFQETMLTRIFETSNLRPLANVITTGTNEVSYPIDDQETSAVWENELSTPTVVDTPQVGELRIPVHNLGAEIPLTQNLIEDASRDVGAWTSGKASDKFSRTENTAFVVGQGQNQPKGILTYPEAADPDVYERGSIGILDVAASTTEGFAPDDFVNLQNLLKEPFQPRAVWAMKRRTFGTVLTLKDSQNQYLLRFGDMFATGAGKQILGNPVVFFDDLQAIADNALAVAYADFKEGYTIVDRLGFTVMIDPFTQRPKVLWAFRKRVGGAVTNWDANKLLRTNVT